MSFLHISDPLKRDLMVQETYGKIGVSTKVGERL